MANDMLYMKKVREQAKSLCETFELDSFIAMLKRRGLERVSNYVELYTSTGWIVPLEIGNKKRYHRGHMLVLLRLMECNDLQYHAGIMDAFDFEDIMSRRAYMCELEAENVRDDARRIAQLFNWIWSENAKDFQPINAVHAKAIIDISLDQLDPNGFYENLGASEADGTIKLVQDLLTMQSEIDGLVAMASESGLNIPTVQYIYDRKQRTEEVRSFLLPLDSPFLAIPTRDMNADERLEFIRTRNELLVNKKYAELIEFYDAHNYLFENELERHASLCVCMGHIYGDLLKDSEKAAASFKEALEYDCSNQKAFEEISHHLREAQKWPELVELFSNHWDTIDDPAKRCALILDCAQIQAFKCQNIDEALGLYERCMIEGYPGNTFDELYKIINGLMENNTDSEKLRALVTLTLHIVNFSQCDKVEALQKKFSTSSEPLAQCLTKLIDAGIQSFKGDQPQALETLCDAVELAPNTNLIDGMLLRICNKMRSISEFRSGISELEAKSLASRDLANIWLRVANVLLRSPIYENIALEYAEKAVVADAANNEAIDLCYNIATKSSQQARAFIYASLKAARAKNPKIKAELENTCNELKLSFSEDDDNLISAYETMLQFDDLKDGVEEGLRALITDVSNERAISILQRVEPKCMSQGMSKLVGDLYKSVIERDISSDAKKGLLERYVGFMLGQGASLDVEEFIPIHAQLYALSPSDRLFTMFKSVAHENEGYIRAWTDFLEDAIPTIDDITCVRKLRMTIAACYTTVINDPEKAADAFANLLKVAPDNAAAFKSCFASFERLERYFDCVEITKAFPLDKLPLQERFNFALKSLTFALVHLYDTKAMKFFVDLIIKDDEAVIPAVFDQLLEKSAATNLDKDQLLCFLEQLETNVPEWSSITMKLCRAKLMAETDHLDDLVALMTPDLVPLVQKYDFLDRVLNIIKALDSESDACKTLSEIWIPKPSENKTKPAPAAAPNPSMSNLSTIDALVKECSDKIDDEYFGNIIESALNSLTPDLKTQLCLKLGALYESRKRMPQAEDYFKRAFSFTQSLELLEFYKRNKLFKKALKIVKFKLSKATDETKNAVKLELAMLYSQIGDFKNTIAVPDDVLANKAGMDSAAIIAIYRQKAAALMASGLASDAASCLEQCSNIETDPKQKEDIDLDRGLLLYSFAPADAKKLQQALMFKGVKSDKMTLLSLFFDIDSERYTEAQNKIALLAKSSNPALVLSSLEQKLRMQKKRDDSIDEQKATAKEILALAPAHAEAKALVEG